jgi:hypothetical protein
MIIQDAGLQPLSMGNMTIYRVSLILWMKLLDSSDKLQELKLTNQIS